MGLPGWRFDSFHFNFPHGMKGGGELPGRSPPIVYGATRFLQDPEKMTAARTQRGSETCPITGHNGKRRGHSV